MSNPIDLRHLKNLTIVVQEGNISRAAIRLYISQSWLSGQMKHLEETAQVGLLVRHSGGVRATAAAEIMIAVSKHIVKLCDDLLAAARCAEMVVFLPRRLGFSSFVDHSLFEMVCSVHARHTLRAKSNGKAAIIPDFSKCWIEIRLMRHRSRFQSRERV